MLSYPFWLSVNVYAVYIRQTYFVNVFSKYASKWNTHTMTICQHFWQYHESGIFRHFHFHVYSWLWRRLPCLLESQLVDQVLLHQLSSSKSSNFLYPFLWLIICFEYNKPHSLSCLLKLGVRLQLFFTFLSNSLAPGL